MKTKDIIDVAASVVLFLLIAAAVYFAVDAYRAAQYRVDRAQTQCESLGGTLIDTSSGFKCIRTKGATK